MLLLRLKTYINLTAFYYSKFQQFTAIQKKMQQDEERNFFSLLSNNSEEEWMNHPLLLIFLMMSLIFALFIFNYKKKKTMNNTIQQIETLDYSSVEEQINEDEELINEDDELEQEHSEDEELLAKVSSTQFAKEEDTLNYSISESSSDKEIAQEEQPTITEFKQESTTRRTSRTSSNIDEESHAISSSTTTNIEAAINHNRLLLQQLQNSSSSSHQHVSATSSPQKQQQGHLLSTHSFLMVCSKCNNLFATFIPPKQDSTLKEPVFPERFKTHPFTFGVLLGDNKRRNVAFTPRFSEEDGEQLFIPTLCQPDSKYLEEEFDCRKIQESDLAEMKDKCKMARDMGKLLRLFCKKCGTKVGSILKEPLQLSVTEDIKLPFNTFMDQEDCSIVEKCHCNHSDSVDMNMYINSENIVNVSDSSTFRKVSLGEWKYSSLASMLFDMPDVPPKNSSTHHNRNRNYHNNNSNNNGRGRFPQRKFNNNQPHRRNNQRPKSSNPQQQQQQKQQSSQKVQSPPQRTQESTNKEGGGKSKKKRSQKRKKKNNSNEPENKKIKVEASTTPSNSQN